MTRGVVITFTDTAAHNLYALILAALGVTQLPQANGAAFFPDFVTQVTFLLNILTAGNSGQSLSIQDQNGHEMNSCITGIPVTIGSGNVNNVSLQAIKLQASASGVAVDVSIVQN
jgi:hypothetical protein